MAKLKTDSVEIPAFDGMAIRAHCEMLHSLAEGIDGKLIVSVYNALRDDNGIVTHHRVGEVDGMIAEIESHLETPHMNAFVGLQVMRRTLERGKRGGEKDIVAVLGLVADMDGDTGKIGDLPCEPNMILETSPGNGQPMWLFDRPLSAEDTKPFAKSLQRATSSDTGTGDVTHVWRIPGTKNWPNQVKLDRGRSPVPAAVTVFKRWDGSFTSVDELRTALEPWAAEVREHAAVTIGALPEIEGIAVSETAAELLAADDPEDRSRHASRVVEQLAFEGLTAEEACAAFLSASGNWFDRYDTKDAVADFKRCWAKFGEHHEEERESAWQMSAVIRAKAKADEHVAVNDNAEPDEQRSLPAPPPMHPDPFSPEAAGGLLEHRAFRHIRLL